MSSRPRDEFDRFISRAKYALILTGFGLAATLWWRVSIPAAKGFLLGATAGGVSLHLWTSSVKKRAANVVVSRKVGALGFLGRWGLRGAALVIAGLANSISLEWAAAGLFLPQVVVFAVGLIGSVLGRPSVGGGTP